MAKKNKRRSAARMPAPRAQPAAATQPTQRAARPAPPAARPAQQAAVPRAEELADEYRYVYGDLKRIGILAASMFALLVVLALAAQHIF